MPKVTFTTNLERHLALPTGKVPGTTVRAALEAVFDRNPAMRGYILDEQGHVRQHIAVFVDGRKLRDPRSLSDAVTDSAEVFVMQALSGG